MEESQQLDMDRIMEHFCKHIENDDNLLNKRSFHSIFQVNVQQAQQAQKELTQNAPTFRGVQPHQALDVGRSIPHRHCMATVTK